MIAGASGADEWIENPLLLVGRYTDATIANRDDSMGVARAERDLDGRPAPYLSAFESRFVTT